MFKALVVFAIFLGSAYATVVVAAEGAALSAPGTNVSIDRCKLAKMSTAQDAKCTRVPYAQLSAEERSGLDATLALAGGGTQPEGACHMWPGGWSCAANGKLCTCLHASWGPNCTCSSTK